MLGSVSKAEDVAQEALLRLTRQEGPIDEPAAWMTTVVTRLSINVLRPARARRASYVGPWLPEPLVEDPAPGPASRAECGGVDRDAGYWARRFAPNSSTGGARGRESRDRAVVPSAADLVEQLKEIARLRAQGALGRAPRARNSSPHKTPTIKRWLAAPPFTQHLTATSFLGLLNILERVGAG